MMNLINIERLKIYRNYGGDIDGILRMDRKSELDAFGHELDKIWQEITNSIQDIEWIEKGLTSKDYADNSIRNIKILCDRPVFEELTKNILTPKIDLLDIIKDYQSGADKAVQIFKEKYNVEDILEGWHRKVYKQTGKLIDEGLYYYAFHGIGLAAHFKDKIVDFDFEYFPEPRHDGFDLWRLSNFIQNQRNKYPEYKDKEKIEREFYELIENGIIARPELKHPTTLYFFKATLNTKTINEVERKITVNNKTSAKKIQTWLYKFLYGYIKEN